MKIVLLLVTLSINCYLLVRKKDLASKEFLPTLSYIALFLALFFGAIAAIFGDVALDKAVELGFNSNRLESHQELAQITLLMMFLLAVWQGVYRWNNKTFNVATNWSYLAICIATSAALLITAYLGGELVYSYGVNVKNVSTQI